MSSGTPTTTPSKVKKTVETPATPNSFELLKRMASKSTPAVPATTSIAAAAVAAANAAAGQNDSPSKKRKDRSHDAGADEPTTPRAEKKKVSRKEKDVDVKQPDTPIPDAADRPRFKRSNTLTKMGGALKRGLSKTFSKKKISSSAAPVEEEKARRKTANVHELLQSANAQLSGRYWRAPLESAGVMALYESLLTWLATHALRAEGIFRKSPQSQQFVRLRNLIESKGLSGDVPADTDPYLVANLLKTLVGELPGSLLTRSAFGLFADAAGGFANADGTDDDVAFAAELRTLIDAHLPKRNQRLLADVSALCRVISTTYVDDTKMTASNLATCISPNFVTPLEELFHADQSSLLHAYKLFHRVARVLIESFDAVFQPSRDSFAAALLREHRVEPQQAPPRTAPIDACRSPAAAAAPVTVVSVEDITSDDSSDTDTQQECFDDALPLEFASPLEKLAAFTRKAHDKTFLYVDETAVAAAHNNERLSALLQRIGAAADVEWHADMHGCMTLDEAHSGVLANGALSLQRIVAAKPDGIEQLELVAERPPRARVDALIASAADAAVVDSPLLAFRGTLYVGFNELVWSMKMKR